MRCSAAWLTADAGDDGEGGSRAEMAGTLGITSPPNGRIAEDRDPVARLGLDPLRATYLMVNTSDRMIVCTPLPASAATAAGRSILLPVLVPQGRRGGSSR
jgi:hypothetical protein